MERWFLIIVCFIIYYLSFFTENNFFLEQSMQNMSLQLLNIDAHSISLSRAVSLGLTPNGHNSQNLKERANKIRKRDIVFDEKFIANLRKFLLGKQRFAYTPYFLQTFIFYFLYNAMAYAIVMQRRNVTIGIKTMFFFECILLTCFYR